MEPPGLAGVGASAGRPEDRQADGQGLAQVPTVMQIRPGTGTV